MKHLAIMARLGIGIMLLIFWGLYGSPLFGVIFVLVLLALSGVRYKFRPYRQLVLLEAAACAIYAIWWPPALVGLWLPLVSLAEARWAKWERKLLDRDYEERTRRLKLESLIEETAQDSQNAARLAELTERTRIAQEIHDHVGHEMHGALIALQTAKKLHDKHDPRAGDLIAQSLQRLESASATLRETVHNLRPAQTVGVEMLAEICKGFAYCPVSFSKAGDLTGVMHWELLAANLKELLTNIAKHSGATAASVRVDGNKDYVRLTVKDNGRADAAPAYGLGLTGMKDRVRMAGGTLTVSAEDGFQVLCVLPKSN